MASSMGAQADEGVRSSNLRTVGLLAALFLLPLIVSFWMYYGVGWRPLGRSNHGDLIDPPRSLPHMMLPRPAGDAASVLSEGRWLLVYVGDGACDGDCRRALLVMRQTRLALHNEMPRVERAMLATHNCCDSGFLSAEHPGLMVFDASGSQSGALLAYFPQGDRRHSVYIVDPHGNLMMRHDARRNPRGLLADLRRLLKLSHIG